MPPGNGFGIMETWCQISFYQERCWKVWSLVCESFKDISIFYLSVSCGSAIECFIFHVLILVMISFFCC